jgi:hypothetical protein
MMTTRPMFDDSSQGWLGEFHHNGQVRHDDESLCW